MKIKRSHMFVALFWVALIGGMVYAIWYGETVTKPVMQAEFDARPTVAKYGLIPVCLDGVVYWMNPGAHSRSWMLSPKYSPGNTEPDTCDAM